MRLKTNQRLIGSAADLRVCLFIFLSYDFALETVVI
jgi:hypothetical protein